MFFPFLLLRKNHEIQVFFGIFGPRIIPKYPGISGSGLRKPESRDF